MNIAAEITVTPEMLEQKALEWEGYIIQAEKALLHMEKIMSDTQGCLSGKSADRLRKKFCSQGEYTREQLKLIASYPQKLNLAATVYREAERSNTDVSTRN